METDDNNPVASSATENTDKNNGTTVPSQENAVSQQPADANGGSDANNVPQAPSAAETDANKKRTTLLDVVKSVAAGKSDAGSSPAGNNEVASKDAEGGEKAVKDDATSEGKAEDKLPFHNHPRWKALLSERDSLKGRAEQYDKIETFMTNNQLTPQEVAEGYKVMALIKHNPFEAYKILQGHLSRLAPVVGETLPEDISKRVDNGDADIESAKELAKARAQANFLAAQQQQAFAEKQELENAAKMSQTRDAVVAWEQSVKQRDVDYSKKQRFVMDKVRLMLQVQPPQSAQEAVAMVEKAYADVNEAMRSIIPVRPAQVVTSSVSSVSAQPQPKTLLDVVRLAAAR